MSGRLAQLKNFGFSFLSIYLDMVLSFALSILIARHLGPERYGVYTFAIWISSMAVGVASLGIHNAVIKFLAESDSRESPSEMVSVWHKLRNMQRVSLLVTLAIFLGLVPTVLAPRIAAEYEPVLWLVVCASSFKAMHMFYVSFAKGLGRFDAIAWVNLLVAPTLLCFVVWAVVTGRDVMDFAMIYAVGAVANCGLMYWFAKRGIKLPAPSPLPSDLTTRIHRHVLFMSMLAIVSYMAQHRLEVFFLSIYGTTEDIAYFNLAYSLAAAAPALLPGMIDFLLLPLMAKTFATDQSALARRLESSIRYKLILTVPVAILGAWYAPAIVRLLYGADYLAAVFPLQVFMLIAVGAAYGGPAGAYLISTDQQKIPLYLAIFAGVLNLVLDLLLIPKFGLEGAVAATIISLLGREAASTTIAIKLAGARFDLGVWLRPIAAGGLSLLLVSLAMTQSESIVHVVVGSALFFACYACLTLVTHCWNQADLKFFVSGLDRSALPLTGALRRALNGLADQQSGWRPFN